MKTTTRLPEVRNLSQILPSGTEGGKEFARIVDLLLFYTTAKLGRSVNLFNDKSGDYYGLDSIQGDGLRKTDNVGYQYKFHPSPLSSNHRAEILNALSKVASYQEKLNLKRWVLVTPDDLSQSISKKGGGDVAWFAGLKEKLKLPFEIEHFGHRKLIALFIESPGICLYYYPELVINGIPKRRAIAETRKLYDKNLAETNNRIEFIGMSVYKAEATHGVPIENIYIPVSAIPFPSTGNSSLAGRTNPLSFLEPGARNVVLGDPGSGKSTLLKFLATVGISERLQHRYNATPDTRIAIPIILRKYADSLKRNRNTSLLDYLTETARADYSLANLNSEFFEFYLESGQALIFFDGMDELPDAAFKQLVRDRIIIFLNCYPSVSAIITSRVVGYSQAFGFPQERFGHYQIAPLLLSEIESFVHDWYGARIENTADRERNIKDLLRILRNPELKAIRTLAENPLLLTIVALVHRIDAVLPDERVVLYQKCTETLLNTWHNWKYVAGDDNLGRGRIERTNRRRIETLASHMHEKSGERKKSSRAVLFEDEVIEILSRDIIKHDEASSKGDALCLAQEFLEFIKQKAGLLIEVGDRQYSFIHLTFQEYLTATALTSSVELEGVKSLWKRIAFHIDDPRWHEVIRLLIAGLKSDDAQAYLVRELIESEEKSPRANTALLLGGLLLDSVKTAERYIVEITSALFKSLTSKDLDENDVRIITLLSTLSKKYEPQWDRSFSESWFNNPKLRKAMLLLVFAIDLPEARWGKLTSPKHLTCSQKDVQMISLLLGRQPLQNLSLPVLESLNVHHQKMMRWACDNRDANFLACISQTIFALCPAKERYKFWYLLQLACFRSMAGPFQDFFFNISVLNFNENTERTAFRDIIHNAMREYRARRVAPTRKGERGMQHNPPAKRLSGTIPVVKAIRLCEKSLLGLYGNKVVQSSSKNERPQSAKALRASRAWSPIRPLLDRLHGISAADHRTLPSPNLSTDLINQTLASPDFLTPYFELVVSDLDLAPLHIWKEALRIAVPPVVVGRIPNFTSLELDYLENEARKGNTTDEFALRVSSLFFYDIWLYAFSGYGSASESPLDTLDQLTAALVNPEITFSRCLRKIALGLENEESLQNLLLKSGTIEEIFFSANLLEMKHENENEDLTTI